MPTYEIEPYAIGISGVAFSVLEDGSPVKSFDGWKDSKKNTVAAAYQDAKDWIEQRKELHDLAQSVMELD